MPLYDFECAKCHSITEKITPSNTATIICPKCNAEAIRKVSAPGGFNLKGSGWYKPSASE